jgi:hypothetical protein
MAKVFNLNCTCGLMDSLGVPNGSNVTAPSNWKYKWLTHTNGETYHEVDLPNGTLISHVKHSSAFGCFDSYTHLTCKKCFKGKLRITSTSSGW